MKEYKNLGHITVGTALRHLADQVSQDAQKIYTQFDFEIDPKWFPVFYVLASKASDSVVNIAKEIKHSHVSVSKIVKEMKVANLIDSHKSAKDSRVTLIKLNARAKAMIPAMKKQCEAVDLVMKQLTQESGVDLWQAITITQHCLQGRSLSTRISEECGLGEVSFVDYSPAYQKAFKALNVEWISQYWTLEKPDFMALDDPDNYILKQGGSILITLYDKIAVGCCALIKMDNSTYELAKMAVSPTVQGKGIGLRLGNEIIEKAKQLGAKRLYLESNTVLAPAVNLYKKLGFEHIKGASSPYERCNVQMELYLDNQ